MLPTVQTNIDKETAFTDLKVDETVNHLQRTYRTKMQDNDMSQVYYAAGYTKMPLGNEAFLATF